MWDDPRAYDVATGWFDDDVRYWESLLNSYRPAHVLELTCGTGRVTVPLAAAGIKLDPGFRLVGLDNSPAFLARLREKLTGAPTDVASAVELVEGDMRRFDLGARFDLIILPYNSLTFLYDIDDQVSCFSSVRRHLADGGRFAIDMSVPDMGLLLEARHHFPLVRQELSRDRPSLGIRYFASSYVSQYEPASQTESTTHYWQFFREDGAVEAHVKHLTWHIFFPRELELLFRLARLRIEEKYGQYDRTPFSAESQQYLWIAGAS